MGDAEELQVAEREVTAAFEEYDRSLIANDLEILDGSGKVLGRSNLADGADWVQLKVPTGTELQARVRLESSFHGGDKPYRLFVVGSTQHHGTSDIQGAHQRPWETE